MQSRTVSIVALLAFLASGCADANPGLLVYNVIAPDDSCAYGVGNPQYSQGAYDVDSLGDYYVVLRYGNQLYNLGTVGAEGPPMADPNSMIVQAIDVELRDVGGATLALPGFANPYRVPAGGGFVPSSDGMTPGEGYGSAQVISSQYGEALDDAFLGGLAETGGRATIIVSMTAVGVTTGGAAVASQEFNFPVEICDGDCLTACLLDDEGAFICRPSCTPGQDTFHIACEPSCVPGS